MKRLLLFGATGNLGRHIAREAVRQGYDTTVVVRRAEQASLFEGLPVKPVVANVLQPQTLQGLCGGREVVISALGKSVSPADRSEEGFEQVDLQGNSAILDEALRAGVRKFVYVSALHAERYPRLTYFRVHHEFSKRLIASGIDYAIVKPPAIYHAFRDVIDLAQRGRLMTIGGGHKLTNPIWEGDLARICVEAVEGPNAEIEAGGPHIYSRARLNEIVQEAVKPGRKVPRVPAALMRLALPALRLTNRNLYDKLAFFIEVMAHDTVAPQVGTLRFEEYIRQEVDRNRKPLTGISENTPLPD